MKKFLNRLKFVVKTWRLPSSYVELYKTLGGLYYRDRISARLLNGVVISLSTMRGGVELCVAGERFYLRHDRFNDIIFLQRELIMTTEWENIDLFDANAKPALNALNQLLKHNPFVPSNEGVRYAGY